MRSGTHCATPVMSTAVAVADKDHVVHVPVLEQTDDVGNMRIEVDLPAQQMSTLAEPG